MHGLNVAPARGGQRGLSLIESLVSLLIVSIGLVGLAGLQARLLKSSTDAQFRVVAAGLADRQLSMALVDATHAACYTYTVPSQVPVACPTTATAATAVWLADVAKLPSGAASAALVTVGGSGAGTNQQLRVQIRWAGKSESDIHQFEATTDVR
jgi:type IV pilus assembly protein PilV